MGPESENVTDAGDLDQANVSTIEAKDHFLRGGSKDHGSSENLNKTYNFNGRKKSAFQGTKTKLLDICKMGSK